MTRSPNAKNFDHKFDEIVAEYIDMYWIRNACPPTLREIAEACGVSSSSATLYIVRRIAPGRLILARDGTARQIIPLWVRDAIRKQRPLPARNVRTSEQVV